jgi:hypothetical protein
MTQALEAASASAAKLPPQEQDALAALLVAGDGERGAMGRSFLSFSGSAG